LWKIHTLPLLHPPSHSSPQAELTYGTRWRLPNTKAALPPSFDAV